MFQTIILLQIFFPIFLSSEKETHENNCTFRPFNCPFIECDEKLVASDVVDHVSYRILIYFSCFLLKILKKIGVQLGFFVRKVEGKAKSFDNVSRILITLLKKSVFSCFFLSEKLKCRLHFLTFLVRKSR